jgi:hypothetical protein
MRYSKPFEAAMGTGKTFIAVHIAGRINGRVLLFLVHRQELLNQTVRAFAMVLTEGFDKPSASAIVFARPTKSRPLYAQMLGRGLRLAESKTDCTVLDFVDMTDRHNIVTAWDFFGHQRPPGEELRDCSQPIEVIPTQKKGAALRLKDIIIVDRIIDLLQPPPKVNHFSMGSAAWHQQPASTKQLILLSDHGIDASGWTKGQAHAAISQLLISDKQRAALLARGFDVITKTWTRGMVDAEFLAAEQRGIKLDWTLVKRAGL